MADQSVASGSDYSGSEDGYSDSGSYSEEQFLGAISFGDNELPIGIEPEVIGSPSSSNVDCDDRALDVRPHCIFSLFVPAAFRERMEGGMHRRFISSHADAQDVMYKHATAPQFFELVVVHCKLQNEHSSDRFHADIVSFPIFVFSSVISFGSDSDSSISHRILFLPSSFLFPRNALPSTNIRAASIMITPTFNHNLAQSRLHVLDSHDNLQRLIIAYHPLMPFHGFHALYSSLSPAHRLHQAMLMPNWPHITIISWLDDVFIYHHDYKFGIWITKGRSLDGGMHEKILKTFQLDMEGGNLIS
ncbi:hypothetical protein CVT26_015306 [Gymnopilus dilepis]|uniref:Uncharacterized protein n=1 Tax=Gymnopilus dilepis TaxID=231916 RepID=A0A409X718_9AGAR|nr:hypothetical protein CVT26_015306 [Gymnopilus dilepis]